MKVRIAVVVGVLLGMAGASAKAEAAQTARADAEANRVVQGTCRTCHNDRTLRGNLSLDRFDVRDAAGHADVAERMVRKLRAGMMPPPGPRRPDAAALLNLAETLERRLDEAAALAPDPGSRPFQRLNRAEYAQAIRDLLDLEVDAGDWLPLDPVSANFDNIADAQTLSATLLEAYLNAASAISRLAVGERSGRAVDHTYTPNSEYVSQHPWDHVEGAPYGTRGGLVVDHVFPADAEYVFGLTFTSGANTRIEDVDVSIDGERVALLHYNTDRRVDADGRGGVSTATPPIFVRAGTHRVAAAFIRRHDGPYEDLIRPHDWSFAGGGSGGAGITTLPHVRDVIITGPYNATGLSETPSRRRLFTCRPTAPEEARPCARSILARLGREAYRRTLTDREVDDLLGFFDQGAAGGGFEVGVRTGLEALLASPHFVLRLEREPVDAPERGYRLSDVDLASRLSFFLWGTPPDDELQALADAGSLTADELDRQALRMLADPRAAALGRRFAAQWFRLQDMDKVRPDPNFFPNYDENLARAMRRETELFFANLVQENRSLLDLYRADYTFVDERLARHYAIPGVAGRHFRRVAYPDDTRRGVLGHGSMLVLTSLANRTSPVLRGKWVMEVLLGTPPPPPPPDIPALEDTEEVRDGRRLTTRERMEAHRSNPSCSSCHRLIDPIGLALDNFDVTAKWRLRENGIPLDTRGDYYDGTPVTSPGELVDALLARPIPLVRTFTENLLAFRHRPARRALRSADRPRRLADGRGGRLPDGIVHHGRGQKRRVPAQAGRLSAGSLCRGNGARRRR